MKIYIFTILLIISMVLFSCQSRKVERTPVDTITDLSGRWNDTDSRLVSEAMIQDMFTRSWLEEFMSKNNKKPVIIAGYIKNRSSEHIEVNAFLKDIERALINSGKAKVVANSGERKQIRKEREDQQTSSAFETIKRLGEETGADYMLIGSIITQSDALGRVTTITYQVDLELVHIETNEKVWLGTKKIKKIITQKRYR